MTDPREKRPLPPACRQRRHRATRRHQTRRWPSTRDPVASTRFRRIRPSHAFATNHEGDSSNSTHSSSSSRNDIGAHGGNIDAPRRLWHPQRMPYLPAVHGNGARLFRHRCCCWCTYRCCADARSTMQSPARSIDVGPTLPTQMHLTDTKRMLSLPLIPVIANVPSARYMYVPLHATTAPSYALVSRCRSSSLACVTTITQQILS